MVMQRDEQLVNCNVLEMEDGLADDEREEEAVRMLEESPSGIMMTANLPDDDEASENDDSSKNTNSSSCSQFGMKESEQWHNYTNPCVGSAVTDAAKQFLAQRFKDITNDNLQIASEDAVYDFVWKWAHSHYPKIEEQREVWSSHLFHLIRFPCMTCRKLKKLMMCNEFDPELASKLVFFKAHFYKAEAPYWQRSIAAEAGNVSHHRYVERAYKYRPIKALEFETPLQQCVI